MSRRQMQNSNNSETEEGSEHLSESSLKETGTVRYHKAGAGTLKALGRAAWANSSGMMFKAMFFFSHMKKVQATWSQIFGGHQVWKNAGGPVLPFA